MSRIDININIDIILILIITWLMNAPQMLCKCVIRYCMGPNKLAFE